MSEQTLSQKLNTVYRKASLFNNVIRNALVVSAASEIANKGMSSRYG